MAYYLHMNMDLQIEQLAISLATKKLGLLDLISEDDPMAVQVSSILDEQTLLTESDQEALFILCSQNLGLTVLFLSGNLQRVPRFLRLALLSSALYVGGIVPAPDELKEPIESLCDEFGTPWPEWTMELAYFVLSNPTIDLAVLIDTFRDPGDSRNLKEVILNPSLPAHLLMELIEKEHLIFDDLEEGIVDTYTVQEIVNLARNRLINEGLLDS